MDGTSWKPSEAYDASVSCFMLAMSPLMVAHGRAASSPSRSAMAAAKNKGANRSFISAARDEIVPHHQLLIISKVRLHSSSIYLLTLSAPSRSPVRETAPHPHAAALIVDRGGCPQISRYFAPLAAQREEHCASKASSKKMTTVAIPRKLKNIFNTNDDPLRCAVCYEQLYGTLADFPMNFCCGRMACRSCYNSGIFFNVGKQKCMLCTVGTAENQTKIGVLKKQAKRGSVWAQGALGLSFLWGEGVTRSLHDALRWLRKATSKGNPSAMTILAFLYLTGDYGCKHDIEQAQKYGEILFSSQVGFLRETGREIMRAVGTAYGEEDGSSEKGLQVLRRLANADDASVECKRELAMSYYQSQNYSSALPWLVAAVMNQQCDMQFARETTPIAMVCCLRLQLRPQAKLWMCLAERSGFDFADEPSWKNWLSCLKQNLRDLRRSCAHCGVGLTRDTRKLCKGCRTCCYCSVDCQKHHWAGGSHRGECKEVTRLKKMLKKG